MCLSGRFNLTRLDDCLSLAFFDEFLCVVFVQFTYSSAVHSHGLLYSVAELDTGWVHPYSIGRVGSCRVGSQNSPSWVGFIGSGPVSKMSNKYTI